MSSFNLYEIDTLYNTTDVKMLKLGLTLLDKEIPLIQEMYDNAVEDGEKTRDFRLSVAILRGTKAGLKDHGFSAGVGLLPLKNLRREIKKRLPEVQPKVKKAMYGEPPVPSPEEANAEQDAIEESMDRKAEKNDRVLQEMILVDKHLTEFEESPDEDIHKLIAEELAMQENLVAQKMADDRAIEELIFKQRLLAEMTENFRTMMKGLLGIN
jgi:hypothetical protein